MKIPVSIILALLLPGSAAFGGETLEKPALSAFRAAPAYFIPNTPHDRTGRLLAGDAAVVAFVQTRQGRVLFTPGGATIGLTVSGKDASPVRTAVLGVIIGSAGRARAGAASRPKLAEPIGGKVNFLVGPREEWHTGLPAYRKLVYENAWNGIDVEYLGFMDRLEYRLIVHPGADPAKAILSTGAETLTLDDCGNLTAELAGAALRMSRPRAWQEQNGRKTPVEVRFQTLSGGRYGFDLGDYDSGRDLVIDPVLNWGTFLGTDSGAEQAYAIATGADNYVYVAGYTSGSDFPATPGAYDTSLGGSADAFVAKLNPTGSALVYATYLGGTTGDYGRDIQVDADGNAYVTGYTQSTDFPTTTGAYDTGFNGDYDAFVTKLNPAGSALVYSTYLGGTAYESGNGLGVDGSGNVFVTGETAGGGFPATAGAYDTSHNSGRDVYVTELNAAGSALVFSTFIGGSGDDYGHDLALGVDGNAYVAGRTSSSGFPTTAGAYDTSFNGGDEDVFVTKLNGSGSALAYSTFVGGTGADYGYSIALDADGNAYVTGETQSADFPLTAGAFDTSYGGFGDVFVTGLNAAGSALVYSTFLSGSSALAEDRGQAIAVSAIGNVYVTGFTKNSDFPVTAGAYDTSYNGVQDVFVTVLDPAGSAPVYSTFVGGSNSEWGAGIVVDAVGNVTVTGWTLSSDFPVTAGAYDTVNGSGPDAFILQLAVGKGDLNHDGAVDSADLSILSGYLKGVSLPAGTTVADCDLVAELGPSVVINATDLCWLKNRVAGNIP